jgi:hypothetical protein
LKTIRIAFSDFWPGFDSVDNYFINMLRRRFAVEVTDNSPDILFYSSYGNQYRTSQCLRVYYGAENLRPDFTGCDFAITFDHLQDPRHYRLPLYALYLERYGGTRYVSRQASDEFADWQRRKKFCSIVVSNPNSKPRINFYNQLSNYVHVDSGGKVFNNIGGPIVDKMAFLREFRFTIAFENSSHPGYTTEKLLEALLAGCIPIYWGDPLVHKEFNPKRFINVGGNGEYAEVIKRILLVQNNPRLAETIFDEPIFVDGQMPKCILPENILSFFEKVIEALETKRRVAKSYRRHAHSLKTKTSIACYHAKRALGWRNFR